MEIGIFASIVLLAFFVVLFGAAATMLILRSKKRDVSGWRLYLWSPAPGVLAVGSFAVVYFLSYASDRTAALLFVVLLTLLAWIAGFIISVGLAWTLRKYGLWND